MLTRWLIVGSLLLLCGGESYANINKTAPAINPSTETAPLLQQLWDSTGAVLQTPWMDSEAASRQGPGGGVLRITIGGFIAGLAAAVLAVVGVGGVGLLAAKALSIGLLALFVAALSALKHLHHKHDSGGGQTVHYVPVHHQTHHEFFHDRSDFPTPYGME